MTDNEKRKFLELFYHYYDEYITLNESLEGLKCADPTKEVNHNGHKITLTERIHQRDKAYMRMIKLMKFIDEKSNCDIYIGTRYLSIPPKRTYKEVAEALNVSISTVARKLDEGIKKLDI
ncbi:MAG: hypothetical protein LUG60_12985 [Erysipelotrichaceae bacterium]|nr:hypothetical protein [Erysipelotrichaceae bacterium]